MVMGGVAYFLFAAASFLAYSATLIDPAMVSKYFTVDSQQISPALVKGHLPHPRRAQRFMRTFCRCGITSFTLEHASCPQFSMNPG